MRLSEKDAAALLGHKGYRRRHKFNATRVRVDGLWFDSKREAAHYGELKLLEKAGELTCLCLQPEFELKVLGESGRRSTKIGIYRADFVYFDKRGDLVVEDVKGFKTALYRWKKKHVEAQYGITVVEI